MLDWFKTDDIQVADPGFLKRQGWECKCCDAAPSLKKSLSREDSDSDTFFPEFFFYIMGWGVSCAYHTNICSEKPPPPKKRPQKGEPRLIRPSMVQPLSILAIYISLLVLLSHFTPEL